MTTFFKNIVLGTLLSFLALGYTSVFAETNDEVTAYRDAINASIKGPAAVTLANEATLDIPDNFLYIPVKQASAFMRAIGNKADDNFAGLIMSKDDHQTWFISVNFNKVGYVPDAEAKNWNADDLLKSLQEGTKEANKNRVEQGFAPINITGWIEKPTYNESAHKLVWSMLAKTDDSQESTVNYNTYALGRDGFFKFNLVTTESKIAEDKQNSKLVLDALHFNEGKLYDDFVEGQDKVAAYGIAALVTGLVAQKLGLLAMAAAIFIKIWKFLILIPLLLGSKIKRLFSRKKIVSH